MPAEIERKHIAPITFGEKPANQFLENVANALGNISSLPGDWSYSVEGKCPVNYKVIPHLVWQFLLDHDPCKFNCVICPLRKGSFDWMKGEIKLLLINQLSYQPLPNQSISNANVTKEMFKIGNELNDIIISTEHKNTPKGIFVLSANVVQDKKY